MMIRRYLSIDMSSWSHLEAEFKIVLSDGFAWCSQKLLVLISFLYANPSFSLMYFLAK